MRFGIITPSILRPSLAETCRSVEEQTYADWLHVVQADRQPLPSDVCRQLAHPQRRIHLCPIEHHNYGNSCRNLAWKQTEGCDFIIYLDDDNFFADPHALMNIANSLEGANYPDWACFPILRFGYRFFDPNPRLCHADTLNIVAKRQFAQWPDGPEYTMDGIWIDRLRSNPSLRFSAFPDVSPIGVLPRQGKGEA